MSRKLHRARVTGTIVLTCALLTAGVASLSACSGDDGGDDRPSRSTIGFKRTVDISRSHYRPTRARIFVGGSVTWINHDPGQLHTAETDRRLFTGKKGDEDPRFDTHILSWGEPYTVVFHVPGTFSYFCSLDPSMKGTVDVVQRRPPA